MNGNPNLNFTNKYMNFALKACRTRKGKCSAKWHDCHFAQENSGRVRMIFAEEILICVAEENIYRSCLIISVIRARILTVCGVTENFAHCLGCTRVHVAMVSTTGHIKMAAQNVNACAPKAVSKILSDTADTVRILARMPEIIKHDRYFPQLHK